MVVAGKDKGKTGEIVRVLSDRDAVIVKGANLYKKHRKPTQDTPGGIISLERALSTAKIMLVEAGKPVRVGLKRQSGSVTRVSKKTGKTI